jgi:hypothetical protein
MYCISHYRVIINNFSKMSKNGKGPFSPPAYYPDRRPPLQGFVPVAIPVIPQFGALALVNPWQLQAQFVPPQPQPAPVAYVDVFDCFEGRKRPIKEKGSLSMHRGHMLVLTLNGLVECHSCGTNVSI